MRYPAKAMLLGSLAWSLLCGLGVALLAEAEPRRGARWLAAAIAVLPLAGAVAPDFRGRLA